VDLPPDPARDKHRKLQLRLFLAAAVLIVLGLVTFAIPTILFATSSLPRLLQPIAEFDANHEVTIEATEPLERYMLLVVVPERATPIPGGMTVVARDAEGNNISTEADVRGWKTVFGRTFKRVVTLEPRVPGTMTVRVEADATEDFVVFPHEVDLSSKEFDRMAPAYIAAAVIFALGVLAAAGFVASILFAPDPITAPEHA